MNDNRFCLDEIAVESPCTVPWETMTGDDRTRFCRLCKLNVHNISGMTRAEAEALLMAREGRICVRYARRADGTILTRDCGPIRAARARRRLALTVAAALTLVAQAAVWLAGRSRWDTDGQRVVNQARRTRLYERGGVFQSGVDWVERVITPPPRHIAGMVVEMGTPPPWPNPTPVPPTTTAPATGTVPASN